MAEVVKKGKKLKDCILKDQNGQDFRLADCKGKRVLLSFHPLAWTTVCALQMQSLEKSKKALDKLNTVAVGLSVDSVPCKAAWAKSLKIKNTRLLADFWPHGGWQNPWGSCGPRGFRKGPTSSSMKRERPCLSRYTRSSSFPISGKFWWP